MKRVAAASAVALLTTSARAAPAISFAFDACADGFPQAVEPAARRELRAESSARDWDARISVRCQGPDDVELLVDDPLTGKQVRRTVSLSGIAAELRARVLGLAVAELVRSSWIELETNPIPALPAAKAVPIPAQRKEAARRVAVDAKPPPRWRGSASLHGLLTYSGDPMAGLQLGVERRLVGPWFAAADVAGYFGQASRDTGTVVMGTAAVDLVAGVGNRWIDGRVGARLGGAWLSGSPSGAGLGGGGIAGFVGGPLVAGTLRLVGPMRLWAEAGWLLQGVRGTLARDPNDVLVSRGWASLGVGVVW